MNIPGINQWIEISRAYYKSNYYTLSIWVNVSQLDIVNNRSYVTTHVDMVKVADILDSWESWANTSYQNLYLNGGLIASAGTGFDFRNLGVGVPITLISNACWINHDDLGNATINLSASHDTTVSLGTLDIYGTATLPNIARASSFVLDETSVEMNDSDTITATISRHSTSFTHKVTFQCGNYVSSFENITTSKTFTIPKEWNNAITSSDTGTAIVTVTTFNGNQQIGNAVAMNFKVTVPSDLVPSIGSFTAVRNDNDIVPSDWEVYVQGKSKVDLSINSAVGSYGSRITEYKITGGGYTYNTASATTDILKNSGTINFVATIKDSRGRTATENVSVYVYEYSSPVVTSETLCYRSDDEGNEQSDGEYVTVVPQVTFSSVSENNNIEIKVNNVVVENEEVYIISNVSSDTRFDVEIICTDEFTSNTKTYIVPTALVSIDFHHSGKGLAIGKVSETENLVEIDMDAKINKDLEVLENIDVGGNLSVVGNVDGESLFANASIKIGDVNIFELVYPIGSIYMSVNSANPSTLFGGTWERWGKGRAVVGVDETDTTEHMWDEAEKISGERYQLLSAAIGATDSNIYAIGYQATGAIPGSYYDFNGSYGYTGSSNSINHATRVGRLADGKDPCNVQPSIACYLWKRTA